jgi:peptidoglycan/xylan/chitin deacetylase (PgdA/CDA1 family)
MSALFSSSMLTAIGFLLFVLLPAAVAVWAAFSLLVERRKDRIPILLYHRLLCKEQAGRGEVPDDEMIWVCYDTAFAAQMRYLREHGYTTLDFDDYAAIRSGRQALPEKPVIVTLDDGYRSSYTMAFPVLQANRQKAVIFCVVEPNEYTRRKVEGIDGFVTAAQMKEMAAQGISIQSHTMTHCILTDLSDEEVRYELDESKKQLAECTGRPVRHIAIPRAGYDRRVKRLVKQAGYQTACCNNKGASHGLSDPLALPRIVVERDMTLDEFARALSPAGAAEMRLLGGIKRIPERTLGLRWVAVVRRVLYNGRLKPLFRFRYLKRAALGAALMYLAGTVWFTLRLMSA